MLFPRFKKIVESSGSIGRGDAVVVGVSGGVDSMVLLDLVCRLAAKWKLKIIAAHANHKLRGRESNADEELVRNAAAGYKIRCAVIKKRPAGRSNVQDAARAVRMEFFKDTARAHRARVIALAHHMGDQAETILIHLLRGAGLKGLSGMRSISEVDGFQLVRPLLDQPRRDILEYATKHKIPFREDSTNPTSKYMRNAVRHKLIPLMKDFNPRIEEHLAMMGRRLAEDDDALTAVALASMEEIVLLADDGAVSLKRGPYLELPAGLRRRVLRLAFERARGSAADLNADQLARMDEIANSQRRLGAYRLPAPWKFTRQGDIISIRR